MKIRAHLNEGFLALECEGLLTKPLEKVILSSQTSLFKFVFKNSDEEVELDCPVDTETMDVISKNDMCVLGFFVDGYLMGSSLVPLEVA